MAVVAVVEEAVLRIEPGFCESGVELFAGHPTLFRVPGERPTVDVEEFVLVDAGPERSDGAGGFCGDDLVGEREGDPHLVEASVRSQAGSCGDLLVACVGSADPPADLVVVPGEQAVQQRGAEVDDPGGGVGGDDEPEALVAGDVVPLALRIGDDPVAVGRPCRCESTVRRSRPSAPRVVADAQVCGRVVDGVAERGGGVEGRAIEFADGTVEGHPGNLRRPGGRYGARMGRPRTPAGRARAVARRLEEVYPEALCELDHRNAFELLVATILSAQSTDANVNRVTPALFERYPTAEDLAAADPVEIETLVHATGFFRSKARNLLAMAARLVEVHGGEVPGSMEDLTALAGVGRKTANVVRSVALGLPGFPVDTHVTRLTARLGITEESDPVRIEREVGGMVPPAELGPLSLRLILHGRRVCGARRPRCGECPLADLCPSAST